MEQSAGAVAAKTLTRVVERFGSTFTAYENKLETEAKLKKAACDSISKLLTMKEVDGISSTDLDPIVADFIQLLKVEDGIADLVDKICTQIYLLIRKYKGD